MQKWRMNPWQLVVIAKPLNLSVRCEKRLDITVFHSNTQLQPPAGWLISMIPFLKLCIIFVFLILPTCVVFWSLQTVLEKSMLLLLSVLKSASLLVHPSETKLSCEPCSESQYSSYLSTLVSLFSVDFQILGFTMVWPLSIEFEA